MRKILVNNTFDDIFIKDIGQTVSASGILEIDTSDFDKYAQSINTIDFIVSGYLSVNDGQDNLPLRYAISLIQDNIISLNEYYTLVDGDDILVGNGQILFLNDEFWNTPNVPDDLDYDEEEDEPPEG